MAVTNSPNITETGITSHDGSGLFKGRTITGSNGITVTNGNGVSGNPDISGSGLGGVVSSQQFTASGTWTRPSGVTKVLMFVTGAGASGSNAGSPPDTGGGGGGAGGNQTDGDGERDRRRCYA